MHRILVALGLGLAALGAAPAAAEHTGPPAPESASLDVDMKLGLNGFRLGARVFGQQGYSGGAWLNGETRADGFSLDGRWERGEGRAYNFKLNADVDEALRRALRWWGGLRDL